MKFKNSNHYIMNNGIGSLQGMSTCIGLKHLPEYRIPLHNYVSCTTVL